MAARTLNHRPRCNRNCKYGCSRNVTEIEQNEIHRSFWSMNEGRKKHFYGLTTKQVEKVRGGKSRRNFTYIYSFVVREITIQVCQQFYLAILDISKKPVYSYHKNCDPVTKIANEWKWGKHQKKVISEEDKKHVRDHINSFPRIPSHYCRADTNMDYLEAELSLSKMYELYLEKVRELEIPSVKEHMYRHIFNFEFNIGFFKPKKDQCDVCHRKKVLEAAGHEISQADQQLFQNHESMKKETKTERDLDRAMNDGSRAVVSIDLENVFAFPKCNVSSAFYKRKLTVYNMTAHCDINKKGYCTIWNEAVAGRGGNEIASAVCKILDKLILDCPNVTTLVLWADSCVPQNRNSYFVAALKEFMMLNPRVTEIEVKYCEPGHSNIQEVDNVHSRIEHLIRHKDIFSPLGLVKILIDNDSFRVIQMRQIDFKRFDMVAKKFQYKNVPFYSVKQLRLLGNKKFHVQYRKKFRDNFTEVPILVQARAKKGHISIIRSPTLPLATPYQLQKRSLNEDKITDIQSLFKHMNENDVKFYLTLF